MAWCCATVLKWWTADTNFSELPGRSRDRVFSSQMKLMNASMHACFGVNPADRGGPPRAGFRSLARLGDNRLPWKSAVTVVCVSFSCCWHCCAAKTAMNKNKKKLFFYDYPTWRRGAIVTVKRKPSPRPINRGNRRRIDRMLFFHSGGGGLDTVQL